MINTKPVTAVIGSYLFLINLIVGSLYNVNAKPLSNAYLIQSVSIDKDCLSDVNVIDNMRQQKMADAGIRPLQIITDKKVYSLAESITITIKNNGSESLTFPDGRRLI